MDRFFRKFPVSFGFTSKIERFDETLAPQFLSNAYEIPLINLETQRLLERIEQENSDVVVRFSEKFTNTNPAKYGYPIGLGSIENAPLDISLPSMSDSVFFGRYGEKASRINACHVTPTWTDANEEVFSFSSRMTFTSESICSLYTQSNGLVQISFGFPAFFIEEGGLAAQGRVFPFAEFNYVIADSDYFYYENHEGFLPSHAHSASESHPIYGSSIEKTHGLHYANGIRCESWGWSICVSVLEITILCKGTAFKRGALPLPILLSLGFTGGFSGANTLESLSLVKWQK